MAKQDLQFRENLVVLGWEISQDFMDFDESDVAIARLHGFFQETGRQVEE